MKCWNQAITVSDLKRVFFFCGNYIPRSSLFRSYKGEEHLACWLGDAWEITYLALPRSQKRLKIQWIRGQHCDIVCLYMKSWHPIWAMVHVPDAPLTLLLPANGLRKAVEDGPSVWILSFMWKFKRSSWLWLWLGPELAFATIWGMN